MLRKLCSIMISVIAIIGVLSSCTTRVPEFIYLDPPTLSLPNLENYLPSDAVTTANTVPEIVEDPETVNDVIYNMGVYKAYYEAEHDIRISLQNYIKDINKIVGEQNEVSN